FDFRVNATGTLNDFLADKLVISDQNMLLSADLAFKNITVAGERDFSISGKITEIITSNKTIKELLPRVLGDKMPDLLDNAGTISLNGNIYLDRNNINLQSDIRTQLGNLTTDLKMQDITNSENTSYQGKIIAKNFHLGRFLEQKILGRVTGAIDVKGKGFILETVDNQIDEKLHSFDYYLYSYQNILVRSTMKIHIFDGQIHNYAPNVNLTIKGSDVFDA